jgi:hypothetical protein
MAIAIPLNGLEPARHAFSSDGAGRCDKDTNPGFSAGHRPFPEDHVIRFRDRVFVSLCPFLTAHPSLAMGELER